MWLKFQALDSMILAEVLFLQCLYGVSTSPTSPPHLSYLEVYGQKSILDVLILTRLF